jgi:histidinol-phosphate aminotransferase
MNPGPKNFPSWLRPDLQTVQPYEAEPDGPSIRLDANESPFDMPLDLKEKIQRAFASQAWNRYPDPACRGLRQHLGEWEGVNPSQILVGNGSDEIIRDLLAAFGGPGTRVVFPSPTFSMYSLLAVIAGSTPVAVDLKEDWCLDIERLLSELQHPASRILFLANPNNPTGAFYSRSQVEVLLKSTDRLVVVDEAYRMFARESLVDLARTYPHMIVLNTFSKSMSLAGLRVGYMIAESGVLAAVQRVRLPFNVDAFAQTAAALAVQQRKTWIAQADIVIQERERVARALAALDGVQVYPSRANFLLVRVADAARIKKNLAASDIAVRGFGQGSRLENCLRVTIGRAHENDRFLEAMKSVVATA